MVCEASGALNRYVLINSFSSLFIGMVCEARSSLIPTRTTLKLSVPSLSGWCVKHRFEIHCDVSESPFSSLFIGMVCEAQLTINPNYQIGIFQFPLYRDGV